MRDIDIPVAGISEAGTVLTSWKDIAHYMGRSVRTVQRWEADFGLPVRRPSGTDKKAVLARPRDLDLWVAARCGMRTSDKNHALEAALCDRMMISLSEHMATAISLRNDMRVQRMELRAAIDGLRQQIWRASAYRAEGEHGAA